MRPHWMPAASKIDPSRYDVVVLPLVPVMPTRISRSLGSSWKIADSAASARRASGTCTHSAETSAGAADSDNVAIAPRPMASRAKPVPSAFTPRSATNTEPARALRES